MRPLKVKLEDGTVKTVLIDDSDTVAQVSFFSVFYFRFRFLKNRNFLQKHKTKNRLMSTFTKYQYLQVVETIGKKMNLKGWEEFTLKYDDKGLLSKKLYFYLYSNENEMILHK